MVGNHDLLACFGRVGRTRLRRKCCRILRRAQHRCADSRQTGFLIRVRLPGRWKMPSFCRSPRAPCTAPLRPEAGREWPGCSKLAIRKERENRRDLARPRHFPTAFSSHSKSASWWDGTGSCALPRLDQAWSFVPHFPPQNFWLKGTPTEFTVRCICLGESCLLSGVCSPGLRQSPRRGLTQKGRST